MNALPVSPEAVAQTEARDRYFDDLERWGFDIAYNAFHAHAYGDVVGKFKDSYTAFAKEARRRGYPACIQIQSSMCAGDRVGIEEAQYNLNNEPERWGEKVFFASFSSKAWNDYLKELTDIFVKKYGFDWVVFEEPMYRVDIPGTKDRFHEDFTKANPDVNYPHQRRETSAYLKVQRAKAETLLGFCRDLVANAKNAGAKKVGVMPWLFIPTVENTPAGTLNPSCDIGRIGRIPDLDILVARMQPDNIYCNTMRTGDNMCDSPQLSFTEITAHVFGKDCIAVSNPTDEHADSSASSLIPFEFYRDTTLASVAAMPCGFTRH